MQISSVTRVELLSLCRTGAYPKKASVNLQLNLNPANQNGTFLTKYFLFIKKLKKSLLQ